MGRISSSKRKYACTRCGKVQWGQKGKMECHCEGYDTPWRYFYKAGTNGKRSTQAQHKKEQQKKATALRNVELPKRRREALERKHESKLKETPENKNPVYAGVTN